MVGERGGGQRRRRRGKGRMKGRWGNEVRGSRGEHSMVEWRGGGTKRREVKRLRGGRGNREKREKRKKAERDEENHRDAIIKDLNTSIVISSQCDTNNKI